MKRLVGMLAIVFAFGLSGVAAAEEGSETATQSMVRGQVSDVGKNPVSGVDVILLSTAGEELARTSTDASGMYSLGCVDVGEYQYEIVPGSAFKGHKVVAPLGPNGLTIAWAVDAQKPALASATATGGPCAGGAVVAGGAAAGGAAAGGAAGAAGAGTGATAAAVVGGTALAAGAGVGIAAGAGAFDSDSATGAQ